MIHMVDIWSFDNNLNSVSCDMIWHRSFVFLGQLNEMNIIGNHVTIMQKHLVPKLWYKARQPIATP